MVCTHERGDACDPPRDSLKLPASIDLALYAPLKEKKNKTPLTPLISVRHARVHSSLVFEATLTFSRKNARNIAHNACTMPRLNTQTKSIGGGSCQASSDFDSLSVISIVLPRESIRLRPFLKHLLKSVFFFVFFVFSKTVSESRNETQIATNGCFLRKLSRLMSRLVYLNMDKQTQTVRAGRQTVAHALSLPTCSHA